ncbi:MAG TPA: DNA-binding protein [Clostridiales bacterium]|nr:sigma factor-like helix-turn-helix DNA-binding protein [Eubacteriales bacterium]HBR32901.1 DNA-binding protein [Clostridiales bacterium]
MEEKRAEICRLMDFYAVILSARQRELLEMYYYEDLSLSEIAENLGITRQGVRDTLQHGAAALLTFEKTLGLIKKSTAINEAAGQIIELTDDERIKSLAGEIMTII